MKQRRTELSQLRNIGPTIKKRLNEIGVYTKQDLEKMGPVKAYQRMKANYPAKTLPVCYYLYSLEGALAGKHWDDIPEAVKGKLRSSAAG